MHTRWKPKGERNKKMHEKGIYKKGWRRQLDINANDLSNESTMNWKMWLRLSTRWSWAVMFSLSDPKKTYEFYVHKLARPPNRLQLGFFFALSFCLFIAANTFCDNCTQFYDNGRAYNERKTFSYKFSIYSVWQIVCKRCVTSTKWSEAYFSSFFPDQQYFILGDWQCTAYAISIATNYFLISTNLTPFNANLSKIQIIYKSNFSAWFDFPLEKLFILFSSS